MFCFVLVHASIRVLRKTHRSLLKLRRPPALLFHAWLFGSFFVTGLRIDAFPETKFAVLRTAMEKQEAKSFRDKHLMSSEWPFFGSRTKLLSSKRNVDITRERRTVCGYGLVFYL